MAPDIPKKQWAQVIEETAGKIQYKQIDVPKPGSDEVLVNVKYSGVCHTDLHAWKGDWPLDTKLPLVGGHEGAGYVVARGELVTDEQAKIGEAVGIKWLNGSCLSCAYCQVADEQLCGKPLLSGYTVDGTFQQYAIAKAAHVAHIPDGVSLDAVSPILCAGITVYRGLKEANVQAGQIVAIVGAGGGLGSLAQQYAREMGLQVIAIDSGDDKKEMCEKMGALAFVDFAKEDVVSAVKKATPDGLGPQAVLLVAVSEKPFQQATQYVRSHGTVVAVGLPADAKLSASVFDTVTRMITIKGSYVGNRADSREAIEFFRRGHIDAPFKVLPLEKLSEVFKQMENGEITGRIVLQLPETSP